MAVGPIKKVVAKVKDKIAINKAQRYSDAKMKATQKENEAGKKDFMKKGGSVKKVTTKKVMKKGGKC